VITFFQKSKHALYEKEIRKEKKKKRVRSNR
jgi:hypothetical protein